MTATDRFVLWLKAHRLPEPEAEVRFRPVRKWRFDLAWPDEKVALEIEGGVFIQGRHTRGAGYAKDLEKYNEAAARGWRVLRVMPRNLETDQTLSWVRACVGGQE